jgi:WD40 repeat protein
LGYWDNLSLSPEGRLAAFSSVSGLELWDLQTCQRRLARPIGRCRAEFDREGGLIVACEAGVFRFSRRLKCEGNSTTGPPQQSRQTVIQFAEPKQLAGPIAPWTLGINASAETLVFGDRNGWVLQHECENREVTRLQTKLDPRLSAVSDDNRFAAVANWNYGGARVWDAKLGTPIIDVPIGAWGIVKFSPDGKLLAATPDGVTLWRTSDWQRAGELHAAGSTPTGLAIAFSPDSRVIAVGQINGILALLDPTTGSEWARLPLRDLGASSLAFTADQRRLVASSISEHTPARVWNLSAVRRELQHRGLDLPHDVLLPQDRMLDVQSSDEILIDDAGVFGHSSMVEDRYSADGRQGSAETP